MDSSTLTQTAFDALSRMILSGELAGGDVVNERRLAEQLGFSRTPVREALGRLEGEGYLRRSGRTLIVSAVDLGEVVEILAVRRVLEAEAARLAVGRMTAETLTAVRDAILGMRRVEEVTPDHHWGVDDLLHLSLARASGNRHLAHLVADLRRRTRMFGLSRIPNRFEPGKAEHLGILDAVERGAADEAAAAMQRHIDSTRAAIINAMTGGTLQ